MVSGYIHNINASFIDSSNSFSLILGIEADYISIKEQPLLLPYVQFGNHYT